METGTSNPSSLSDFVGGKVKGFWERKEGTTGMAVVALAAVAIFVGWGVIVPFIVATLLNTIYAGILIVALAFMLATRGVWVSMFQSACRGLTRLWANIDPIGIMEEDLRQDKKELLALDKNMDELSGQVEGLQKDEESTKDSINQAMRATKQARDKIQSGKLSSADQEAMNRQLMLNGNDATRKQDYLKSLLNLMSTLKDIYKMAEKWRGHLDYLIQDRENFITISKKKRRMSITGNNIVNRMKGILHVDPDRVYMLNAAIEAQAAQYNQRVGTIKNFVRTYRDTLVKGDLQNEMHAQQALRQLEEWERQQGEAAIQQIESRDLSMAEVHPLAVSASEVKASTTERAKYFQ